MMDHFSRMGHDKKQTKNPEWDMTIFFLPEWDMTIFFLPEWDGHDTTKNPQWDVTNFFFFTLVDAAKRKTFVKNLPSPPPP